MKQPLGWHTLVELHGCDPGILGDVKKIRVLFRRAAVEGGASVVKVVFHQFKPWGVSGVVVISESHLTVHTWPEHGYAAVDIFTCSPSLDVRRIQKLIADGVGAGSHRARTLHRGKRS